MLPLDDPRWQELHPFFGRPEDVPGMLADWWQAIGTDYEELLYTRDLFDLFLHQGTITNLAFAIVPWLVAAATTEGSRQPVRYLTDVALVEWRRLHNGPYAPPGRPGEPPPDWLADDYRAAIEVAGPLAEDLLDGPISEHERKELWTLMPALFGNDKLATDRRYGKADDPSRSR